MGLNSVISQSIGLIRSDFFDNFMILFSNYIIYYGLIVMSIFFFLILFIQRKKVAAVIFGSAMGLGLILSYLLKIAIREVRPLNPVIFEKGFSFPSMHSVLAVIFFGYMIYLFGDSIKSKFGRVAFFCGNILLILLTGFSRVYLNVHWFWDVIFGFFLGIVIFFSSLLVKNKLKKGK